MTSQKKACPVWVSSRGVTCPAPCRRRIHGLRIVCYGKTSGDEQFSLRQPARVVRCVRQIDTADSTAKSRRAAADRAACEHKFVDGCYYELLK